MRWDEPQSLDALLAHARALVGVEIGDLADGLGLPPPAAGRVRGKGWAGLVIQQELGLSVEGTAGPDFPALGVELKTVPVDSALRPRESTAICQIDPVRIAGESWETSSVRRKLAQVLFVALEDLGRGGFAERRVAAVRLWSPDAGEEALLRADFDHVVRAYFRRGRTDEITGRVGRVMQVRPKGRNAADTRAAFGPDGFATRVGKCGFYLRPAFVDRILSSSGTLPPSQSGGPSR